MKMKFFVSVAAATILLTPAMPARVTSTRNGAIKEAVAQFYTALNKMLAGDIAPMKPVWSHAEDVTYMGPSGGFQVGWASVLKNWEGQAAMKLGGYVKPSEIWINAGSDIAVVSNNEKGETRPNGKSQKFS